MLENLKTFWNTGTFDTVLEALTSIDPVEFFLNPIVLGYIVLLVAMNFIPLTHGLGQLMAYYTIPVIYLFSVIVVAKNDTITHAGPFVMVLSGIAMVLGWFVWAKMLRD